MTVNELINHLTDLSGDCGIDSLVAIDLKLNGEAITRSEIKNIKVYSGSKDGKNLITLETDLTVLGSVDTNTLVNKRINELIDAANDSDSIL